MFTNYHTHTTRCLHATGTEEEYVIRAINSGFSELGFSDHAPYLFSNGFYSDYRMDASQYSDYYNTILRLKEKYADRIKLYIGLELEYYPKFFEQTIKFIMSQDIDYLILGQHFINNEYDGVFVNTPFTVDDNTLKTYVNQSIEAMQTGLFTYFAHPDLIRYNSSSKYYEEQMSRLCIAANQVGIPLEINLCGLRNHRNYPCERFFKLASDYKNEVIIGFDAHSVDDVFSEEVNFYYNKAKLMVSNLGLKLIDRAELIKPKLLVK